MQFGLRYSFSQLSANAAQLLPPPEAADSRPLYHLSVHMNVFRPQSFITVVRRGASEDGPYVGEFEHGPYERFNRVVIGSTAKLFKDAVKFKARYLSKPKQEWTVLRWSVDDVNLQWAPESVLGPRDAFMGIQFKCVLKDSKDKVIAHLATYNPAGLLSAREGIAPMPSLLVEQPGLDLADHIILSLLILQRQEYPLPVRCD